MKNRTVSMLLVLPEKARRLSADHKKYLSRLRDRNPHKMDEAFAAAHDEVFAGIDCLDCANCCRVLGPRWRERDIERAAKALNMHPGTFRLTYLQLDEDNDYVLKKLPCAFLDNTNSCIIYDHKPRACSDYPYTNMKNMRGLLSVARKNIPVCPAVFEVVEKIRQKFPL